MGRVEMPTLEKPSRKKKTARKQEGWPGTEKLKVTWSDGIDGDQMPTHEPPDSCTQPPEEPESGTCTLGGADPAELEVETRGGAGPAFLSHGNGAEAATKRTDQSRFDGGYGAGPREAASGGNSFQEGESGPVTTGDGDGGKVSASDGSISRRDLRPQTVVRRGGISHTYLEHNSVWNLTHPRWRLIVSSLCRSQYKACGTRSMHLRWWSIARSRILPRPGCWPRGSISRGERGLAEGWSN